MYNPDKKLYKMTKHQDKIAVTSFYCFVNIENIEILQPKIMLIALRKYVKGTILLAKEGFNGSLSGTDENIKTVIDQLIKLTNAKDISIKTNYCDKHPFEKFKVKLKKEIVTLGAGDLDVENLKGEYISPEDWDKYLTREDVVLIDTRNDYEVAIGSFKGAIDPKTPTFRDFPEWVEHNKELLENKTILMCCTGGIRCEKSTAYMKHLGYEKVYHLKGGILQYLEDTANKNNMWHGDCFVFDDRRAVDQELAPSEGHWLVRENK